MSSQAAGGSEPRSRAALVATTLSAARVGVAKPIAPASKSRTDVTRDFILLNSSGVPSQCGLTCVSPPEEFL